MQLNNMLSSFVRMVDRSINDSEDDHDPPIDKWLTQAQVEEYVTRDCVWSFPGQVSEGPQAIANDFNNFHRAYSKAVHHYTNRVIKVCDKAGGGREGTISWNSDATWITKPPPPHEWLRPQEMRLTFTGNFEAQVVEEGGQWKFSRVNGFPQVPLHKEVI